MKVRKVKVEILLPGLRSHLDTVNFLFSAETLFHVSGLPGIGLIAIRVTVAAMLLVNGSAYAAPQSMGCAIGSLVAAVCLVSGILTSYAATFAGCLEFWRLCTRDNVDLFHSIAAIVVSLALGVLGPGAYSVDNKIFGRRLVNLPHGSEGNSSDVGEAE